MFIDNIDFEFITTIEPERDSSGKIIEYSPASRYANLENLPLNRYGKGPFCRFRIRTVPSFDTLGVYVILGQFEGKNEEIQYVGKCTGRTSTLSKRFNYGYGSIQPRNCFRNGQSTNCRINKLILDSVRSGKKLSLFFHQTKDGQAATNLEAKIISIIGKPPWNTQEPIFVDEQQR